MRRREFLTLIGCAAATWPVVGHAQQQITPLVGVLCTGTAEALERYLASFREGMHELGYVEGSNIRFEFRFADGYLDRLPDLANELVRLNPRVIVSTPLPANLAARKATSAIPIVMASGADPVGFRSASCSCRRRLADPTSLIRRSQRWARSALKVCSSLLTQLFIRGVGRLPTLQQRHVCRRFSVIASMSKLADS